MKYLSPFVTAVTLVALGCGPPPVVEEPVEPFEEATLPPPPPPPSVRCKIDRTVSGAIAADRVALMPGESDVTVVLAGPRAVRFATVDDEGELVEGTSLVKLRRATAAVSDAGSEHVVVVEAARPRRGASQLTVSRFGTDGSRVGQALRIARTKIASQDVSVACNAEACLLIWAQGGDDGAEHVARAVALGDEGPALLGEEPTKLPGAPNLLWRRGDGFEVVVGDERHTVSAAGELGDETSLGTPRGGHLRLASSPTGAAASMYVESAMPYGLTVAVVRAGTEESRDTRLWEGATDESRFGLVSGQLGFGAAWARPEGEVGPYAEAEGAADAARIFFRGFSVAGVPHGDEIAVADESGRVGSIDVAGLSSGYVVAWTTPGRRRAARVSMARMSCWELTDAEAAAERAAASTSSTEGTAPAAAVDGGPAAEAGDAGPSSSAADGAATE